MVFRNRAYTPADDIRETPTDYFNRLDAERHYSIDACALPSNAKCPLFYATDGLWQLVDGKLSRIAANVDGLTGPYTDQRVWCNPGFSVLEAWILKAWRSHEAELWDLLMPGTRADRPFWHRLVEPYRDGRGGYSEDPTWKLTTHYDPFRLDFLEDGHPVYQKNKDGTQKLFKTGPKKSLPKPSTAMFGCMRLEWRHV